MSSRLRHIFVLLTVCLLTVNVSFGWQVAKRPSKAVSQVATPLTPNRTSTTHIVRLHPKRNEETPIVSNQTSTVGKTSTQIKVDINLGNPVISSFTDSVAGSRGRSFSSISWPKTLTNQLPASVTVLSSRISGLPQYPILAVTFAIPESAHNLVARLSNTQRLRLPDVSLAPAPELTDTSSLRRFVPAQYIQTWNTIPIVGEVHQFRTLRTVTVQVPLATKVSSSDISALTKFSLVVEFEHARANAAAANRDPYFSALNQGLVVNPADLSAFAVPLRGPSQISQSVSLSATPKRPLANDDTIYSWIDQSAKYVKLFVTRDGLYRVTSDDISSRGHFNLKDEHWSASSIVVYNRGKEIPIWVDSDANGNVTAIEFYGEHLPGYPREYYNMATDTNVYWLTSNEKAQHRRFTEERRTAIPTDPLISSGLISLHHERDYFYYDGDKGVDEATVQRTEIVSGERFYWQHFLEPVNPGGGGDTTRLIDTFRVSQLPTDVSGRFASFHFFLRGMSSPGDTAATHQVVIRLNGETIADRYFRDYDSIVLEPQIPLSKIGPTNIVEVISAGTVVAIDEFYLDFYSVSLEAGLAPSNDTAIARGQWNFTIPKTATFERLSLASNAAHLYNLTTSTRVFSNGGAFPDSMPSNTANYVAATDNSFLQCDRISIWGGSTGSESWSILHPASGADYIVLTHPLFLDAANRLASRRAASGMRTMVVTTDEVYSAFDFGSNEPEAIRRFLRYAYNKYPGTPVGFVTLFGDAAWDPKGNLNNPLQGQGDRTNQRSFVPTEGQPVSDFYFTLVNGDLPDTIQPSMLITRIPVSTPEEANNFLTKLVEYENASPASWNKDFLFVVGGDAGGQHEEFMSEIHDYIYPGAFANYTPLSLPPLNVRGTIIGRTSFGDLDATHVADIQDALREGQAITYFTGHGATFTTDVLFPDPVQIRNIGLYTTLITLSCRTGAFAENNMVTMNEAYLRASEGGATMCFGTTGYGNTAFDDVMTRKLFTLMRQYPLLTDTTRAESINMTQLFTAARLFAADSGGGFGFVALNSRLQYSILGDAAMGFCLKPQPELSVGADDVKIYGKDSASTTVVNLSDSVVFVSALIHNNGYSAERPVVVRIRDLGPTGIPFDALDTLASLDDTARVYASFPLNGGDVGEHTISVFVDPFNQFPEIDESNNESIRTIFVSGLSVTDLYPYEGAKGGCDLDQSHVHLIVLVPQSVSGSHLQIQVDTALSFSSPLKLDTLIGSQPFVEFDVSLSQLHQKANVYWWRSRIISGSETSLWQNASFNVGQASQPEFNYSSTDQLRSSIRSGLAIDNAGSLFLPQSDTIRFQVTSHGSDDPGVNFHPVGLIEINDKVVYQLNAPTVRFALAVLRPDNSGLDTVYEFDTPDLYQYDSIYNVGLRALFDSIVKAIPNGRKVIFLTNIQPVYDLFVYTDTVRNDLMSLGSKAGFTGLSYHGSYAMIGQKGSAPGTAIEQFRGDGVGPAIVFDTAITSGTYGVSQTPPTAGATKYRDFRWTGPPVPPGSELTFTLLGTKRDGSGTSPVATLLGSSGNTLDLSGIDTRQYSRLAIKTEFSRTASGTSSPEVSSLALSYDAAPEFVFTTDSIQVTPSSVLEGDSVTTHYTIHSLTCTDAGNIPVSLYRIYKGTTDTVALHSIPSLSGHSDFAFSDVIGTRGEQGKIVLTASVNLGGVQNEQLLFNDQIRGSYQVGRDTSKPAIEVLLDERHTPDLGYVSSRATIHVNLFSQSTIRQLDTNSISVYVLNLTPPFNPVTISAQYHPGYSTQSIIPQAGPIQEELLITPTIPFAPGQYELTISAHDANGNIADTVVQRFTVTNENGIEHVMNYPNPFTDKTDFTFMLRTDPQPGTEVHVIIYSVAGRKLRTLVPTDLHAGFNLVPWDGRDQTGNDVANGTYLYRVVINGSNSDGTGVSDGTTEKAVRAR